MRLAPNERPVAASALAVLAALALGPIDAAWASVGRDALVLVAALVAGAGIARRAVGALARRDVSIEVLVTIAAVGAIASGAW